MKWTKEDVTKIFELLIERGCTLTSSPKFRGLLDRDKNLLANQITREANGNIAYRTVDFDVSKIADEDFWDKIDETPYQDMIEENAAVAILKMAEKLNLIN